MKIVFIVDETSIMLPLWLDSVIEYLGKDYKIMAITPLDNKGRPSLYRYLYRRFYNIPLFSLFKLIFYVGSCIKTKIFFSLGLSKTPGSIKQTAIKHRIKILPTNNVNSDSYIKSLKKLKPDIVFSSCSQIFKEDLLLLPKIACINRHSAWLPAYGGLFPIFWAVLNKEKTLGVSMHKMTKGIDKGEVIFQRTFPIKENDTLVSLYQKSYDLSVFAAIEALRILKERKNQVIVKGAKPSYFSFPKDEDWKMFWKKGFKFI